MRLNLRNNTRRKIFRKLFLYLSEFNELFLKFYSSNIPTKTVLCDDKDSPLMYDGVRTLLPKNQAQTQTWEIWNPLKMDPIRNRISRTMCRVIHFHMKSRGVQGRIFVQTIIEKCATNFCFENREVGIKKLAKCSSY